MKKWMLGLYAIVIAVGAVGFIAAKKQTNVSASTEIKPIANVTRVKFAGCSTAKTPVGKILCAVQDFEATLTPEQLAAVQFKYEKENAIKWSNLPCVDACHIGLKFSTLTDKQRAAAMALVATASGKTPNEGFSEINQIIAADDIMKTTPAAARNSYSSGNYYIAFLGTPSATGTWQLQFGGHHLAVNQTYSNGVVTGSTPSFVGVEPQTFVSEGKTYVPIGDEQETIAAMIGGLDTAQLTAAKLPRRFNDVIMGPRANGQFPDTKVGLPVSSLNAKQKTLIMNAIKRWVLDVDDATAADIIAAYTKELNNTYIAFSGSGKFDRPADYARIDGPGIWLEFACQAAVVGTGQVHYHTVWRDHKKDYGNNFTF